MPSRFRVPKLCCAGLIITLLAALTPSRAESAPPERTAVEHLRRCEDFEGTTIGDGGSQPATVTALRMIVAQPRERALSQLHELIRDASPAGRLYALCGLYKLDKAAFERALPPFLSDATPVGYNEAGCLTWPRPMKEAVRSSSRFALRLPLDGSMGREAWLKTQPWAKYVRPELDIVGGGWPHMLLPDEPGPATDETREDPAAAAAAANATDARAPIEGVLAEIPNTDGDKSLERLGDRLAAQGDVAWPAIKTLLKSNRRSPALVALAAIDRLGHAGLGRRGEEAAAALAPHLESRDSAVFCAAARALQELAPWNTAARPALRRVLARISEDLRQGLSEDHEIRLGDLVRWSTTADDLPILVTLIASESDEIAANAAERCGELGPIAGAARSTLLKTRGSWDRYRILRKIGLEPGCAEVAVCIEHLDSPKTPVVIGAIRVLETLGRRAPNSVVEAVAGVARKRSESPAIGAFAALARRTFTGETDGLARALIRAGMVDELAEHLTTTKLADPDDLATLRAALTGEIVRDRDTVVRALGKVGAPARALEPELSALKATVGLEGWTATALASALHAATGERAWPCEVAARLLETPHDIVKGLRALQRFGPIPACHVADVEAVIPRLRAWHCVEALKVLLPLGPSHFKITRRLVHKLVAGRYSTTAVSGLVTLARQGCAEALDELHALAEGPKDSFARYLAREAVKDLDAKAARTRESR